MLDKDDAVMFLEGATRRKEGGPQESTAAILEIGGLLLAGTALTRFEKRYGVADVYALLTNIAASPDIDPLTAILAMMKVAERFGLDSLRYDDRFPACLLTARPAGIGGLPGEASIVRAFVEGGATKSGDEHAYVLLVGLLAHFHEAAFRTGVSVVLGQTRNLNTRKANRLHGLINGTLTPAAALTPGGVTTKPSKRRGRRRKSSGA